MKGHIRKRGERSWAIVIDEPTADGQRRRRWIAVKGTKRDAEKKLTEVLNEINTGGYVEPHKTTLDEYLQRWLAHAQSGVGRKTHERYKQLVEHNIIPKIGSVVLARLQPIQIADFYADLLASGRRDGSGGLSPQTVVHVHRVLRLALKQAVRWRMLSLNPADAVEPPSVQRTELETLDHAQAAWLLVAAESSRLYLPVVLALATGMRRGEILGLRWQDIDFSAGKLSVRRSLQQTKDGLQFKMPKSGKGRVVALPAFAVAALRLHKQAQDGNRAKLGDAYADDDLVCGLTDGKPWPPEYFSSAWGKFRTKIGLGISFHGLRHTHATQLLGQGVHPKIVSERLGHASVQITLDRYSHALPNLQEDAASQLDALMQAAIDKNAAKPV